MSYVMECDLCKATQDNTRYMYQVKYSGIMGHFKAKKHVCYSCWTTLSDKLWGDRFKEKSDDEE